MKLPKFGPDPMDIYNQPISSYKTQLATVFQIKPRQSPDKPGRSLSVVYDQRLPFIEGFKNRYSYIVSFEKSGEKAGNHYHQSKQEIFVPVIGNFKIVLEDINTKVREELSLKSCDHQVMYIKPEIAHAVIADSEICSLLVLASFPNNQSDEFFYQLT